MKQLSRRDKNGVRTATDLERRYKFQEIEYTKEELEELKKLIVVDENLSTTSTNPVQNKVITEALNNKVNKEAGKGLSTNDFTNELKDKLENMGENAFTDDYKEQVEANTELRHIHNNMTLLQSYEQTEDDLRDAVGKRHTHNNKEVLDTITQEQIKSWNENSFSEDYKQQIEANTELRHIHNNMTLLQSYEQTEDNLRDAVSKRHTHSNKAILDGITQEQINKWNTEPFTDDYKQQIEDNTELRHIHNNMTLLQSYEQTEDNLRDAVTKRHTHSNKSLLDTYTQTEANLAAAVSNKHTHSNKALLDTYTQTNANIASAVTNNHTHSNKSVLDGITSTLISNWNNAASNTHSASITSGTNTNTIRLGKVLIQSGRVTARVTTGGTAIQLSFNFPVAFKNAPTLLMQPSTSAPNSIWVTTAESTTTQGKYWFYRPNTSATVIEWLAIGEGV